MWLCENVAAYIPVNRHTSINFYVFYFTHNAHFITGKYKYYKQY